MENSVGKLDVCQGGESTAVYFNGDPELIDTARQFQYVCCNIPGPGTDLELFEEVLEGCLCTGQSCDTSSDSKCSCVRRYGWAYDSSKRLLYSEASSVNSAPVVECNNQCLCPLSCTTRVVQHGVQCQLEVFLDQEKGLSLRTLQHLERNTFICEYAGEILTVDEAKRRTSRQTEIDMNYIFVLREHCASGIITTYVDPKNIGNIGRFLNHSCDPNLFMVPVRVHNAVPKLCLFARRAIEAGEELTYSYGSSISHDAVNSEADVGPVSLKLCKCNAANCKKFLPFDGSLL